MGHACTALAQSQSWPEKKVLAKHRGVGFDVSGSHLHWRLLCCSLKSEHVGSKGKMVPPHSLVSRQVISYPLLGRKHSQKSKGHQHTWCPAFLCLSLAWLGFKTPNFLCFIFGLQLGFKTPALKQEGVMQIHSVFQIRASLHSGYCPLSQKNPPTTVKCIYGVAPQKAVTRLSTLEDTVYLEDLCCCPCPWWLKLLQNLSAKCFFSVPPLNPGFSVLSLYPDVSILFFPR